MAAPFLPFLSEQIYQKIKNQKSKIKSVHLEDWTKAEKKSIKKDLNQKMNLVRKIVSLGLRARIEAKIKVRQPLTKLQIKDYNLENEFLNLIKDELNLKKIEVVKRIKEGKDWVVERGNGVKIALNTKITSELKEEGKIREFIRQVQALRKKAGLTSRDKILIYYLGTRTLNKILKKNKKFILKETRARDLEFSKRPRFEAEKNIEISQEQVWLGIKKIK
jgi:isoleucyl-tRNA synthetase